MLLGLIESPRAWFWAVLVNSYQLSRLFGTITMCDIMHPWLKLNTMRGQSGFTSQPRTVQPLMVRGNKWTCSWKISDFPCECVVRTGWKYYHQPILATLLLCRQFCILVRVSSLVWVILVWKWIFKNSPLSTVLFPNDHFGLFFVLVGGIAFKLLAQIIWASLWNPDMHITPF